MARHDDDDDYGNWPRRKKSLNSKPVNIHQKLTLCHILLKPRRRINISVYLSTYVYVGGLAGYESFHLS